MVLPPNGLRAVSSGAAPKWFMGGVQWCCPQMVYGQHPVVLPPNGLRAASSVLPQMVYGQCLVVLPPDGLAAVTKGYTLPEQCQKLSLSL